MIHRQQVYSRYHQFHRLFWQQSEARCPFVQYAREAFRQKKTPHTSSRQTKPEESTVETVSAHELGCAIPCSPQCFIPLFSPLQLSVCGLIISQHTGELTQTTHLPHCGCIRLLPSSFVRPSLSYSRQSYLLSLPMIHTIKLCRPACMEWGFYVMAAVLITTTSCLLGSTEPDNTGTGWLQCI